MAVTGPPGPLPASAHRVQFALAAPFTPEKALNLRAIPVAYQDPPDYGKLSVLQIPKGQFVMGPEQADAAIDQEPEISQKLLVVEPARHRGHPRSHDPASRRPGGPLRRADLPSLATEPRSPAEKGDRRFPRPAVHGRHAGSRGREGGPRDARVARFTARGLATEGTARQVRRCAARATRRGKERRLGAHLRRAERIVREITAPGTGRAPTSSPTFSAPCCSVSLIYVSGVWNFLANTRLLDLLIRVGVVEYHDAQTGFIKGDSGPRLLLEVAGSDSLGAGRARGSDLRRLLADQGRPVPRASLAFRESPARSLSTRAPIWRASGSTVCSRTTRATSAWRRASRSRERLCRASRRRSSCSEIFIVFEIVVFAMFGLFVLGWSTWLGQTLLALPDPRVVLLPRPFSAGGAGRRSLSGELEGDGRRGARAVSQAPGVHEDLGALPGRLRTGGHRRLRDRDGVHGEPRDPRA